MVHPNQGGCWFCYENEGDMLFSTEFDCYLHEECLKKQDDRNPEAVIMSRELSVPILMVECWIQGEEPLY